MNIDGEEFYVRVNAKTKVLLVTYLFEKKLKYTRLKYLRKMVCSVVRME